MALLRGITLARAVGLIYLIVVATGVVSLVVVPSRLIVSSDAVRTVENITASQGLFRLGIAAGLICNIAFLILPLAIYKLLSPVDRNLAVLMVIPAVVSVPISLCGWVNMLDVLTLLSGRTDLVGGSAGQLNTEVIRSLARHENGVLIAEIFWGLWLLPLGLLVLRSGVFPKLLGVFLVAGCVGYLIDVFGTTLVPGYTSSVLARIATKPASIGEIGICLWLLIMGMRTPLQRTR